jgi:hypothetical protein
MGRRRANTLRCPESEVRSLATRGSIRDGTGRGPSYQVGYPGLGAAGLLRFAGRATAGNHIDPGYRPPGYAEQVSSTHSQVSLLTYLL